MHESRRAVGMGRQLRDRIDNGLGKVERGVIEQKGNYDDSQNAQLLALAVLQYVLEKIGFHHSLRNTSPLTTRDYPNSASQGTAMPGDAFHLRKTPSRPHHCH